MNGVNNIIPSSIEKKECSNWITFTGSTIPKEALQYIQTLPFSAEIKNLRKYGKLLVNALPGETTNLLMELCTNYKPKQSAPEGEWCSNKSIMVWDLR